MKRRNALFTAIVAAFVTVAFMACSNGVTEKPSASENPTPTPVVDPDTANLLSNGDFAAALNWGSWAGDGGAASFDLASGAAVIDVTAAGGTWWTVQFWHGSNNGPNAAIPSAGKYTVSFTASATVARDVRIELTAAEAALSSSVFDFALGTTPKTYSATVDVSGLGGNPLIGLKFGLGKISALSVPSVVTLDNVKIEPQTAALPTETLSFSVTDGTDALVGAAVTLSGVPAAASTALTDASGAAAFEELEPRLYAYSVSLAGYIAASGVVNLETQSSVNVALDIIPVRADTYLYRTSGSADLSPTLDSWSSGSTVNGAYASDAAYNPCIESILSDNLWGSGTDGFVVAFTGLNAGFASGYDNLKFKMKCTDLTNVTVKFAVAGTSSASEKTLTVSEVSTDLTDDWVECTVPLAQFGELSSYNEFAFLTFQEGLASNAYITDVYLDVE